MISVNVKIMEEIDGCICGAQGVVFDEVFQGKNSTMATINGFLFYCSSNDELKDKNAAELLQEIEDNHTGTIVSTVLP